MTSKNISCQPHDWRWHIHDNEKCQLYNPRYKLRLNKIAGSLSISAQLCQSPEGASALYDQANAWYLTSSSQDAVGHVLLSLQLQIIKTFRDLSSPPPTSGSKYTTRASKTKLYKYSKTSNEIFGDLPCITAITKPSNVHRAPHWSFSKTTVVIKKKKLTVIYFTYVKMSIFSVLIVFSG